MKSILISNYKSKILCMYVEDSRVVDLQLFADEDVHLKNVYVGKVKNIVSNIGAAFVEVAPSLVCYLNLNEVGDITVLNRTRDKNDIKQGDEILVQIVKGAVRDKAPVCSGRIHLPKDELEHILQIAPSRKVYSVLYSGKPQYLSFLLRMKDIEGIDKVTCVDEEIFGEVNSYIESTQSLSPLQGKVTLYQDDYPVNKLYKVDSCIAELTSRTVWLKSGANIVIDYTEAMTVIDVNTGKSIEKNSESMFLDINIEAATEAFRQIRLRNLSGMILIDFINDSDENTAKLIEYVSKLASTDPVNCKYIDITGLGIVELTRAKKYKPLYEMI